MNAAAEVVCTAPLTLPKVIGCVLKHLFLSVTQVSIWFCRAAAPHQSVPRLGWFFFGGGVKVDSCKNRNSYSLQFWIDSQTSKIDF